MDKSCDNMTPSTPKTRCVDIFEDFRTVVKREILKLQYACERLQEENRKLASELGTTRAQSFHSIGFDPNNGLHYPTTPNATPRLSVRGATALMEFSTPRTPYIQQPLAIVESVPGIIQESLWEAAEFAHNMQRPAFAQAVTRWHRVAQALIDGQNSDILLRPVWQISANHIGLEESRYLPMVARASDNDFKHLFDSSSLRMGDVIGDGGFCRHLVRHPDRKSSIILACLASAFVIFDIAVFPLMIAFDLHLDDGFRVVMLTTTWYWTVDVFVSFFQGYHTEGIIEMRLRKVVRRYITTWFLFDVTIISVDWITFLMENNQDLRVISLGRTFRLSRFFRCLRVLRVMRLLRDMDSIAVMLDVFVSEYSLVIARVFTLLTVILFINHYICCGWAMLALQNSTDDVNWMTLEQPYPSSSFSKYISALHWSLTQFTPATNNIRPRNIRERLFACVVVFFGLIMFSTFVSSLTNAVMEIKKIRFTRLLEESQIREFMHRRKVPTHLCMRVWLYYRKQYRVRKRSTPEGDIVFLKMMPTSLRQALYVNIYMPIITAHPLFDLCRTYEQRMALLVCSKCITEQLVAVKHEMFCDGDVATHMLFIETGEFGYDSSFYFERKTVVAKECVAEAVLWTHWVHCGLLVADLPGEVIQIDASRFEEVMKLRAISSGVMDNIRKYAALYLQGMQDYRYLAGEADEGDDFVEPMTDLWLEPDELMTYARRAFEGKTEVTGRHSKRPSVQSNGILGKMQDVWSVVKAKSRLFVGRSTSTLNSSPASHGTSHTPLA